MTKTVYLVGLPIWADYYGSYYPHTLRLYEDKIKAINYKKRMDKKLNHNTYEIRSMKLNE